MNGMANFVLPLVLTVGHGQKKIKRKSLSAVRSFTRLKKAKFVSGGDVWFVDE